MKKRQHASVILPAATHKYATSMMIDMFNNIVDANTAKIAECVHFL
jgi:hypothetical protein